MWVSNWLTPFIKRLSKKKFHRTCWFIWTCIVYVMYKKWCLFSLYCVPLIVAKCRVNYSTGARVYNATEELRSEFTYVMVFVFLGICTLPSAHPWRGAQQLQDSGASVTQTVQQRLALRLASCSTRYFEQVIYHPLANDSCSAPHLAGSHAHAKPPPTSSTREAESAFTYWISPKAAIDKFTLEIKQAKLIAVKAFTSRKQTCCVLQQSDAKQAPVFLPVPSWSYRIAAPFSQVSFKFTRFNEFW